MSYATLVTLFSCISPAWASSRRLLVWGLCAKLILIWTLASLLSLLPYQWLPITSSSVCSFMCSLKCNSVCSTWTLSLWSLTFSLLNLGYHRIRTPAHILWSPGLVRVLDKCCHWTLHFLFLTLLNHLLFS